MSHKNCLCGRERPLFIKVPCDKNRTDRIRTVNNNEPLNTVTSYEENDKSVQYRTVEPGEYTDSEEYLGYILYCSEDTLCENEDCLRYRGKGTHYVDYKINNKWLSNQDDANVITSAPELHNVTPQESVADASTQYKYSFREEDLMRPTSFKGHNNGEKAIIDQNEKTMSCGDKQYEGRENVPEENIEHCDYRADCCKLCDRAGRAARYSQRSISRFTDQSLHEARQTKLVSNPMKESQNTQRTYQGIQNSQTSHGFNCNARQQNIESSRYVDNQGYSKSYNDPPVVSNESQTNPSEISHSERDQTVEKNPTSGVLMEEPLYQSSDHLRKLNVPKRYHGPGCCMEINVMQKHGDECSFRCQKRKQSNENLLDDRVGSYEVIGRININTCNMNRCYVSDEQPKITLADVYPILATFCSTQVVNKNTTEGFIRHTCLVNTLPAPKSFPNFKETSTTEKIDVSYELQELFFCKETESCEHLQSDKTYQVPESKGFKQRKWYYSLFSCIFAVQ